MRVGWLDVPADARGLVAELVGPVRVASGSESREVACLLPRAHTVLVLRSRLRVGSAAAAPDAVARDLVRLLRGSVRGDTASVLRSLSTALARESTLVELRLPRSLLQSDEAIALARGLCSNRSLQVLGLSLNADVGSAAGAAIGAAIEHRRTPLRSLAMAHCGLGLRSARALARVLETTALEELVLSGNPRVGDGGAQLLLQAMAKCRLRKLAVAKCGLGTRAAAALEAALAANERLQELDLSENPGLGDCGAALVASGVGRNKGLRVLRLTGCELGNAAAEAFGKALASNATLEVLKLNQNAALSCAGAMALARGLGANQVLRVLDARDCAIRAAAAQALLAARAVYVPMT